MSIAGWEWARHKAKKQQQKLEDQKRTREFAEIQIEWQLPETMLPIRSKKFKWGYQEYHTCWYIHGSDSPKSFVYLLKEIQNDEVRYVGLTDDPPRRHMEHRRNYKIGAQFKMIVVDVGDASTEREWIARCISNGCNLLSIVSTKPR